MRKAGPVFSVTSDLAASLSVQTAPHKPARPDPPQSNDSFAALVDSNTATDAGSDSAPLPPTDRGAPPRQSDDAPAASDNRSWRDRTAPNNSGDRTISTDRPTDSNGAANSNANPDASQPSGSEASTKADGRPIAATGDCTLGLGATTGSALRFALLCSGESCVVDPFPGTDFDCNSDGCTSECRHSSRLISSLGAARHCDGGHRRQLIGCRGTGSCFDAAKGRFRGNARRNSLRHHHRCCRDERNHRGCQRHGQGQRASGGCRRRRHFSEAGGATDRRCRAE